MVFNAPSSFLKKTNDAETTRTQPNLSPNRAIKESDEEITIDFGKCTTDFRRFDVMFGSTTINVNSMLGDACIIFIGGEIENPDHDGKPHTKCEVPRSTGVLSFAKTDTGVDMTPIQSYCYSMN